MTDLLDAPRHVRGVRWGTTAFSLQTLLDTSSNDWRKLTVHNYTRLFHGGNAYENLGMTSSVRMLFTFHSRKDEQGGYRGEPTISAGSIVQYYDTMYDTPRSFDLPHGTSQTWGGT